MTSIAQAYVEILPSTRGMGRALQGEMGGIESTVQGSTRRGFLGGFAGVAGAVTGAIGAIGIGAAIGTTISRGLGRALNLQDARAQLTGLGHDAESVETVMESALASVRGTAFGLDAAATTAAGAVAAGIAPGADLTRTLTLVGDAATIAGTDMGAMGAIFNKVAAGDMIQGDVLAQLGDQGIPILQFLADELGVTAAEVRNLASKGEIDFATFQSAMEKGLGGAAQASGATARGAFANMGAAIGRLGAQFTTGAVAGAPALFTAITGTIDGFGEAVKPLSEQFNAALVPAMERLAGWISAIDFTSMVDGLSRVSAVGSGVAAILFDGNYTSAFGDALGVDESSRIVGALFRVREGLLGTYELVANGNFTSAFRSAFGVEEDAPIVDLLFRIRNGFAGVVALVGSGDFTSAFRNAFNVEEDAPIVTTILGIREAFGSLGQAFGPLIPQILQFATSFSPLMLIGQALLPVLPQIALVLADLAATLAGTLGQALQIVIPILTQLAGIFVGVLSQALATILPVIGNLVGILGPILGTVLQALMPVLQLVGELFAALVPILMPLVSAVLSLLQPILSLLAPLVQLVGAILPPLIGLFLAILRPILNLAVTLLEALMPAITFIIEVISTLITWIAQALTWFVDLVTGAGTAGDDLMAVFEAIPGFIEDIFAGIGSWLVDSGRALIQGFIDGISAMVGAVGDAVGGVMDFVAGFFPNSPAKRGPLSGSGWRAIGKSGGAIEDAFASGFSSRIDDVMTSGVQVPRVPMSAEVASYAASAGSVGSTVNVYPSQLMDPWLVAQTTAEALNRELRG